MRAQRSKTRRNVHVVPAGTQRGFVARLAGGERYSPRRRRRVRRSGGGVGAREVVLHRRLGGSRIGMAVGRIRRGLGV